MCIRDSACTGHSPGGRSVRLPAPARPPVWSAASATHARLKCPADWCSPSRVRLTGLRVSHSHWSSHSPECLFSLKITSYTLNCTPSPRTLPRAPVSYTHLRAHETPEHL